MLGMYVKHCSQISVRLYFPCVYSLQGGCELVCHWVEASLLLKSDAVARIN